MPFIRAVGPILVALLLAGCGEDATLRRMVAGASCTQGGICPDGHQCFEGTCRPDAGKPCDESRARCVGGYACESGLCAGLGGSDCDANIACVQHHECVSGQCVAGVGGACGELLGIACAQGLVCAASTCLVDVGGACGPERKCAPGAVCQGDVCKVGPGGQCLEDGACVAGYRCKSGVCRGEAGSECSETVACVPGLACEEGECRASQGSACGEEILCRKGLRCEEGTCRGPAGSICADSVECRSGNRCHAGTCLGLPGAACTDAAPCAPDGRCEGGVCRVPVGEACGEGVRCISGLSCEAEVCRAAQGGACDTSDECLTGLECHIGVCKGSVGATCSPAQPCGPTAVCESGECRSPVGGTCGPQARCASGLLCQEGLCRVGAGEACGEATDCLAGYSCVGGRCLGVPGSICSVQVGCASGAGCEAGECRAAFGTPCSDTVRCAASAVCDAGRCTGEVGASCLVPGDCASALTCSGGLCVGGNGSSCTTSAHCEEALWCDGGTCRGARGAFCSDSEPCGAGLACEDGACVETLGGRCEGSTDCLSSLTCSNERCLARPGETCARVSDCSPEGICEDGRCRATPGGGCGVDADCSGAMLCESGTCAAQSCTTKSCLPGTGGSRVCQRVHKAATISCDDSLFCTIDDHCDGAGGCVGGRAKDCSGEVGACKAAACDETRNECVVTGDRQDGTACDADGEGCTVNDACRAGVCAPGAAPDCSAVADSCNAGACSSTGAASFACIRQPKSKDLGCDDGRYCTVGETCNGNGSCGGGSPRDCAAQVGDQCNNATCDDVAGACVRMLKQNGTICSDGNECSLVDKCTNGQCIGSQNTCTEERISVAALTGAGRPKVASLGYGRYVTHWTSQNGVNAFRLTASDGGRENEEANFGTAALAQAESPLYVDALGNFSFTVGAAAPEIYATYSPPLCSPKVAGTSNCPYPSCAPSGATAELLRVWSVDSTGRTLANGARLVQEGRLCRTDISTDSGVSHAGAWARGVGGVPGAHLVGFSDGTLGLMELFGSPTVTGFEQRPYYTYNMSFPSSVLPSSRYTMLGTPSTSLARGTSVDSPIPHSRGVRGSVANAIDASSADTYFTSWVTDSNAVMVRKYDKYGQPFNQQAAWTIAAAGSSEVYKSLVLSFASGKFAVFWDQATSDGNGRDLYGRLFYDDASAYAPAFLLHTRRQGDQRLGGVARFSNDGFVAVWDDSIADTASYGVRAQRFRSDGAREGEELAVNTIVDKDQKLPSVAVLDADDFVVGFTDFADAIWTRRFKKDGSPAQGRREMRANTTTAGSQMNPAFALNAADAILVAYESPVSGFAGTEILTRLFDAQGRETKAEFFANARTDDNQTQPAVAGGPDRFVVAWTSAYAAPRSDDVRLVLLDGQGRVIKVGGEDEFGLMANPNDYQRHPAVEMDPTTGEFLVVWEGYTPGASADIYGRFFDKNGAALTNEFVINAYPTAEQLEPSVAFVAGRNEWVVAWASNGQDGSGYGIYQRRVSRTGTSPALFAEVQAHTATAGQQRVPKVAAKSDQVITCWQGDSSGTSRASCQLFRSELSVIGQEISIAPAVSQSGPVPRYLAGGEVLVAYDVASTDSDNRAIQFVRIGDNGQSQSTRVVANRTWTGLQHRPSLAVFSTGAFLVGWQSDGQDGDQGGAFFRLLPAP